MLDTPLLAGTANMTIGQVVTDSSTFSVSGVPIKLTINSTVTYSEILATKDTHMGTFTEVLKMTIDLNANSIYSIPPMYKYR